MLAGVATSGRIIAGTKRKSKRKNGFPPAKAIWKHRETSGALKRFVGEYSTQWLQCQASPVNWRTLIGGAKCDGAEMNPAEPAGEPTFEPVFQRIPDKEQT